MKDILNKPREEFRKILNDRVELGKQIAKQRILNEIDFQEVQTNYEKWHKYNKELLVQSFDNPKNKYYEEYSGGLGVYYKMSAIEQITYLRDKIKNKINKLESLIDILELIPCVDDRIETKTENNVINNKIFIVHGHNMSITDEVAKYLRQLKLEPIILQEQSNSGNTIIEKFEKNSDVGFAIILLTDDDEGKAINEKELKKRARQNVILEMGYFIGKLGRGKTCAIYTKDVEIPSDIHGLVYIKFEKNWIHELIRELKSAGINVDANDII